jgi:iron complex transport system permease protein
VKAASGFNMVASRVALPLAFVACVLTIFVTPWLGGSGLDAARVWRGEMPDYAIFWQLRLPRTLLGAIAGAALAMAGALFQALLRDALATPFSLGVSAASALGAVLALSLNLAGWLGYPAIWLCALAGGAAALALVMIMSLAQQRFSSFTLLLTGVALNSICTACILLLHSLAGFAQSFQITRWLMGGLDAVSYSSLAWLSAVVGPLLLWMVMRARQWNLLAMGDAWAAGRGVNPRRLLLQGYVAGSLLAATITSLAGPIGFVGLIVPHALRGLVGSDHRVLLPVLAFGGAAFLVLCDTVARTILAPAELPVGVITSLLGGPFFVWLLWSRGRATH